LLVAGCGDHKDEGVKIMDISGGWIITTTYSTSTCELQGTETDPWIITQDGSNLSLNSIDSIPPSMVGSISGTSLNAHTVGWIGSHVMEVSLNATVSSDGTFINGTATGAGEDCTFTSTFTGSKQTFTSDVEGVWNATKTVTSSTCGTPVGSVIVKEFSIMQSGAEIKLNTFPYSDGIIAGNLLSATAATGTPSSNSPGIFLKGSVSADGNTILGSFESGNFLCSYTADLTMVRQ